MSTSQRPEDRTPVHDELKELYDHREDLHPTRSEAARLVIRAGKGGTRKSPWRTFAPAVGAAAVVLLVLVAWPREQGPQTPMEPAGPSVALAPAPQLDMPLVQTFPSAQESPRMSVLLEAPAGERVAYSLGKDRLALDGNSRAKVVRATKRNTTIRLESGTMVFDVDSRGDTGDFVVEAGAYKVRVVGTRFAVTLTAQRGVIVAVTEGTVEVTQPDGEKHLIKRGETFRHGAKTSPVSQSELARLIALSFGNTPRAATRRAKPKATPWTKWLEAGNYESVEIAVEKRLKSAPKDGAAWLALGRARQGLGEPRGAVEAYENAIRYGRGATANEARWFAAKSNARLGNHKQAVALLKAYQSHHPRPREADATLQIASSLMELGDQALAAELLREAMVKYGIQTPAGRRARQMLMTMNR